MFRYVYVDHLSYKCPKPPKDNEKWKNQVRFSERGNRASQNEPDNGDNDNDQEMYASMAQMYGNDKSPNIDFSDCSKCTNWILDSGATCNMTP